MDGLTQINNINYISVNGFINNNNVSIFGQSMADILGNSGSSNPQPTFNGNSGSSNPQPTFNRNRNL